MKQGTRYVALSLAAVGISLGYGAAAQTPEQEKTWADQRELSAAIEKTNAAQLARAREARRADPMSFVRSLDPLTSGGWTFRAVANDGSWAAYTSDHQMKKSGKTVTVWLRQEYAEPQLTEGARYLSAVQKSEFDCKKERTRALLMVYYAKNNIQGNETSVEADPKTPMWAPIIPGTRDEYNFVWACSGGKLTLQ